MNPGLMAGFVAGATDPFPLGAVLQSPLNLERITEGRWLALDGRDCNRVDYPDLSSHFPAGVFTPTVRTLSQTPGAAVIVADSNNFLALSVNPSVGPMQASSDGVTWTTTGSFTASDGATALLVTPSRIIAAGGAGVFASPRTLSRTSGTYFTTPTPANMIAASNWAATTGGLTTNLVQGLAYSPTANGGSGRTVLIQNGASTTVAKVSYLNDGATAWNAASGGSSCSRLAVCWTGQRFICLVAGAATTPFGLQISSDGATWSDAVIPMIGASGGVNSIASDGNGTVVIPFASGTYWSNGVGIASFLVSKDHGASWRVIQIPQESLPGVNQGRIDFINGRFVYQYTMAYQAMFSVDGLSWQVENMFWRTSFNTVLPNTLSALAFKNGVYCCITTGTAAFTATEDLSKFRLPLSTFSSAASNQATPAFIKARN